MKQIILRLTDDQAHVLQEMAKQLNKNILELVQEALGIGLEQFIHDFDLNKYLAKSKKAFSKPVVPY